MRRSVRGKSNDEEFAEALDIINKLMIQVDNDEIDFYYFDEFWFYTGTLHTLRVARDRQNY